MMQFGFSKKCFFSENQMEAVVFQSRTLIRFPNLASFGRRPIFTLKDIADGYPIPSKRIQLTVSSNRPDGNARHRPPRRSSAPGRTRKNQNEPFSRKAEALKNQEDLKNLKSNNQEEIIALFRKIQTSIAEESASSGNEEEDSHRDEHGADSILEALRESRRQVKGKTSKKTGAKVLTRKSTFEEKEMHHTSTAADFKLTRPPSKFMKKSPIPSPPIGNGSQLRVEASQAIAESKELKLPSIEKMKFTELKALAKSRGIKGYSKLKRNELLDILKS